MKIQPYKIDIPQIDIDDLKQRLMRARWPHPTQNGQDWSRGVPYAYLKELVDHWLHRFDWRTHEARLNAHDQIVAEVDGQRIHCFHIKSKAPNAMPLLCAHGWPSSSIEFLKLVEPLTNPPDAKHAFDLVLPTTPGFGLSSPVVDDWDAPRTARAYSEIMKALGYKRYGVHGGDIGADIIGEINHVDANVVGVHSSTDMPSILWFVKFMGGDPLSNPNLTDRDKQDVQAILDRNADGGGYLEIQKTKPLTIGYALSDSPIGQLAWIVEKMQAWTDETKALPEDALDRDQMLTNISLYWFTRSGASAAQFIYNNLRAQRDWGAPSHAPTGMACFGAKPAGRALIPEKHMKHWSEVASGGHFPAMEVPALLAADLRTFFDAFR
jgi:pimeloyl-ACP methyl ester carboxylesterase